jgi:single-strand DNA-binding protein
MLNKVILIGHLGQAPEIKRTKGERRYCMLSVATSKRWRDKDSGEKRERTDWHRVVLWAEHAVDLAEKHCVKGSRIWIEGELSQRDWTDDKGVKRYVTEIVVMPFTGTLKLMDKRKGGAVPDPDETDHYGAPVDEPGEMEKSYV